MISKYTMRFSRKGILRLPPEKHSLKTLSLAYAILTDELMEKTKIENPSRRSLRGTRGILSQMKKLGDCARYHPEYFDAKGNALVTLLRHGAEYLETHRFYEEGYDSRGIGDLFAYKTVMLKPRPLPELSPMRVSA